MSVSESCRKCCLNSWGSQPSEYTHVQLTYNDNAKNDVLSMTQEKPLWLKLIIPQDSLIRLLNSSCQCGEYFVCSAHVDTAMRNTPHHLRSAGRCWCDRELTAQNNNVSVIIHSLICSHFIVLASWWQVDL